MKLTIKPVTRRNASPREGERQVWTEYQVREGRRVIFRGGSHIEAAKFVAAKLNKPGWPIEVPPLPHGCGSWIVRRKRDKGVIGEFYKKENVEKFNGETCEAISSLEYLYELNEKIKNEK